MLFQQRRPKRLNRLVPQKHDPGIPSAQKAFRSRIPLARQEDHLNRMLIATPFPCCFAVIVLHKNAIYHQHGWRQSLQELVQSRSARYQMHFPALPAKKASTLNSMSRIDICENNARANSGALQLRHTFFFPSNFIFPATFEHAGVRLREAKYLRIGPLEKLLDRRIFLKIDLSYRAFW